MSTRNSHYLALGGLLILIILYALNATGNLGPNPIGTTSRATNPLIVPAGYAFAIWGPIYLGLLVFPIYQWVKRRNEANEHPAWAKIRVWYAANVVANGLWLAAASYDMQWTTVAIIGFMLVSLLRIRTLLEDIERSGQVANYWLEKLTFSLYFGWVTLATVLNVASALHFYDWAGFGISQVTWTVVMSGVAALIAGFTAFRFRDAAYAGVVVWAFTALAVRYFGGEADAFDAEATPVNVAGGGAQVLGWLGVGVAVAFVVVAALNLRKRPVAG